MHSTCSDGNLSPAELVRYAKKRKVDIIALTDHNSCDGLYEAISEGKRSGIVVIPAVELSKKYKENRVHILGYFKDDSYNNELFKEVLRKIKGDKIGDLRSIFGSKINFNGYKKKLYVESGIQLLRFFGATVVLAHPVLLSRECFFNIENMDFDGIEARYFLNNEQDTEFYIKFAKEKGLYSINYIMYHNLNFFIIYRKNSSTQISSPDCARKSSISSAFKKTSPISQ